MTRSRLPVTFMLGRSSTISVFIPMSMSLSSRNSALSLVAVSNLISQIRCASNYDPRERNEVGLNGCVLNFTLMAESLAEF